MIDVGIVGCGDRPAAELVRILLNHPDVELKWVMDPQATGMRLDSIVPGIVGECDLTVEAMEAIRDVDLVFLCGNREEVSSRLAAFDLRPELRIIDLSGSHNTSHGAGKPWAYGMSEMQRRILVNEARWVTIPGNVAAASLLALIPMARNLLLNSPIELQVALGTSALDDNGNTLGGVSLEAWATDQERELSLALTQCQSSFSQPLAMTVTRHGERRTLAVTARFKCGIDGDMVRQLYDTYYDDHNFVYMVDRRLVAADVENTNKCLITIEKDDRDGVLTVNAIMDALLKGSAGMAVHAMNLMYGLHERVGLALKGSGF